MQPLYRFYYVQNRIKKRAVEIRLKGTSIKEIARQLDVAQSTVSLWVRNVKLSSRSQKKILLIQSVGRQKAAEANRRKKITRERRVIDACDIFKDRKSLTIVEAKIYLAMLYWGEGSKTGNRVVFMNSDPSLIGAFISLLRMGFNIKESKLQGVLHLHSYHKKNEMVDFWSKCTKINKEKISIYQKKESRITKKEDYKGCFSLRCGDVATMQEILLIIDRFVKLNYN